MLLQNFILIKRPIGIFPPGLFIFIVLNTQEDNIVLKLEFILKFVLNKKIYVNYNPYAYRKIIYMKNVEKHYIEKKT